MRIVLASASPRRHQILADQGLEVEVCPTAVDERRVGSESPTQFVERLSKDKAKACPAAGTDTLLIAADTIVALGDDLLGKPRDQDDAAQMLARLSGREHQVHTGLCVLWRDLSSITVSSTTVTMHSMTRQEISWYIDTREPFDKAGAYAIQGHGALFVSRIEGSYWNVVGLPIDALYRSLGEFGLHWRDLIGAKSSAGPTAMLDSVSSP